MIGTPCGFANYCIWHMVIWNHGPQYWLKKSRQENCKHVCVCGLQCIYLYIYICIRRRKCWVSLNIFTLNVPVIIIIMTRCLYFQYFPLGGTFTDHWWARCWFCPATKLRDASLFVSYFLVPLWEHDPLVKGHNATWCIYIYTHFSSPRRYS